MPEPNDLTRRARTLRRSMTDAERVLWVRLRNRGLDGAKFRRQVPIGPFIADFACMDSRLIVEVDGGQHSPAEEADNARTRILARHGYTILRFWNNDVLQNLDGVLVAIMAALREGDLHPHPDPLPEGEGVEERDEP